ncbi:ubiquitin-specific protease doa4 [Saxophila tyrrhenica]|uniref:Ubiquitin-specific protease doa4 n=1 Tax=Saxophila tyrrhenica TaxID=1690608 RepID=A0AAV9NWU2_9PEZI|nr:ubiquitin-specific protease doa4 [Saxophila tyrrhenica]
MSAATYAPQPPNGGPAGPGGSRPSSGAGFNGGERKFAHLDDLKRMALEGFHRNGSAQQLLQDADVALNQSTNLLDFSRRPDLAYVEYLRAFEIVAEVLPHHKSWPDLKMDNGGMNQKHQLLLRKLNVQGERFQKIKEIIVNNNRRSGVQPTSNGAGPSSTVGMPPQQSGNGVNGNAGGQKIKPTPSPKPESMHAKAVPPATTIAAAGDALKDRLAALRTKNAAIETGRPDSRGSTHSSIHSSPTSISMPNAGDYGSRDSFDSLTGGVSRLSMSSAQRPLGPRGMPNGNGGPPLPGKLPLNTSFAAMPQEPKATYSPARNMQAQGNIDLPRQTPRSLVSTSSRKSSLAPSSSASYHAPNGAQSSTEPGDYFPPLSRPTSNSVQPGQLPRRRSVNAPETSISAQRLYDYLDRYNVLLLDFRPRQEFDYGHIFHRSVVCIDPIHVTRGMSADELLDRMVISPDIEQEMFMNRDKYDIIVYYDTGTRSETFMTHPSTELETKLKYLHEALFDFNQDKPLQRPPILLVGGIDAWADLVGSQALATSDTSSRAKPGRPLQRRPVPGPLQNRKRRLREYNPLDEDEERKWRERARAESVVLTPPAVTEEPEGLPVDGIPEEEEEPSTPYNATIDSFNQRFPEAGELDRYAFGPLEPKRAPPAPPPKVPLANYPRAPPASVYPSIPARPMPAAPRPSYTGVSDRAGAQNVPAARSSSMVPYIPAKYLSSSFKIPQTGLINFRFTCYMNATLQALSATKALSIFFMEEAFRKHIQRENWKGTKGIMPELYANVIQSLWKNDVSCIKPTSFRKFCGRQNSEWMNDSKEQDAKEFFDFLLDCLHEDLNIQWSKPPLRELTTADEIKRERMPKSVVAQVEWARYTRRNQSFPLTLFGGQYSSLLRFAGCGHTSTTHEAFYALSVEIPTHIRDRQITLDDCIRSFCQEERLDVQERAKCDQCNERRDSTKQLTFTRAPQYLVIHFKRFNQSRHRATKIDVPIDFPLENFDLGPYMLPSPSQSESELIARDYGSDYLRPDPTMTGPYTYSAYAVIRHIGRDIESGHYTSLVRDLGRSTWRCFNDDKFTDFEPGRGGWSGRSAVQNHEAYIVFYQRNNGVGAGGQPPLGPGGVGKI